MPISLTSGTDLHDWRARIGWSVATAAAELRIQQTSLRNLESGRKAASLTLLRLAELLEDQHAAPTPAPAQPRRPARRRKPRPVALTDEAAYEAALAAARVGSLSPEAAGMLRAEVDRQRRAGAGDAEPYGQRRAREAAWQAETRHTSALYLTASAIALSMPR